MKKNIVAALIVILTVCLCQSLEARKKKTDHLTEKYKKFLQDVHYIITKRERDVFLKLKTDRERDILMHAFWKHRDPTKGTPENEFKEEHYHRLRHVEQFYGRSKTRAGWETDRGKVYIILGKPLSIQRFEGFSTVLPTEVWHYQQAPRAGLPPAFNIVFFDRNKIGEYVLYSPLADGPQRLLVGFQGRPGDYLEAYEKLKDYNSFLAKVALSLVPGEEISPGQPSMSSDFLLRNVEESPKKLVSDLYARKFLQYKGVVEVEYSVNFINSKSLSQLIIDSEGNNNLSYIVELERLSMDRYDDRFFTNIAVYGTLTHRSGKNGDNAANIYQFEKNFSVRKDEREFRELQKSSFAITDHFPIIPGEFHLSLVVKNTNSKEFTVHEADISVPHGPNGKLLLMAPLLAYDVNFENTSGPAIPFGTRIGRFLVDPTNKFKRSDSVTIFFQLFDASKELKKSGNIKLTFQGRKDFSRDIYKPFSGFNPDETDFLLQIPLDDFPPDYYNVVVSVEDKNKNTLVQQGREFLVTPLGTISRPQTVFKATSLNRRAVTAFILGTQYMNVNEPGLALAEMEKAYNLNPRIQQFALGLSRLYLELKKYDKIETVLTPFLNPEKPDFQLYFLLGNANQKLGNYAAAVTRYTELMRYHGLSVGVLNSLASSYYNMGNKAEARKAWEQSLKIDPKQQRVQNVLESLKNEN